MAKSAVLDLVESDEVTSLVFADMNRKSLETLKKSLGSGKVRIATVDITDHENLVGIIRGSDAVINGTVYYHNVEVMKACLEVKTH